MSGGVKIISEDDSSSGILSEARRRKLSLIGGISGGVLFMLLALVGASNVARTNPYLTGSRASEGGTYTRPARCDRCDQAGGVSNCLERFNRFLNLPLVNGQGRVTNLTATLRRQFAYLQTVSNDRRTVPDESQCGACDLSPQNGNNYGDRTFNQSDIDVYNSICVAPSPTPTPTSTPTPPPQSSCSRCDFNGDGLFSADEGQQLAGCVFNQNNGGCGDRDANADGRVDAGDISWCTVNCQQAATPTPSTTADCRWCDFNADGVFNSDPDATQLAACAFVTGVNDCINLDINRDRILDAGDVAALNICNGAIFNSGQNPFGMACDLNRDGTIDAGDMSYGSSRLTQCIFNLGANNHCATDPNRDNQLNAADISWCSANCAPHN